MGGYVYRLVRAVKEQLVELVQTQLFAMIHIRIKVRGAKGQAVFDEVLE